MEELLAPGTPLFLAIFEFHEFKPLYRLFRSKLPPAMQRLDPIGEFEPLLRDFIESDEENAVRTPRQ